MQNNGYYTNANRSKKRRSTKRLIIFAAVLVVTALTVALLVPILSAEPKEYAASKNVFLNNISVNGVSLGGMTYNDALDRLVYQAQQAQSTWKLDIVCNGFTYSTITYDTLGIGVNYQAIETALRDAWKYGHTGGYEEFKADAEYLANNPVETFIDLTGSSGNQLDYILNVIAENIYTAPQDAQLISFNEKNEENPFVIQNEISGRHIDTEAAKADILAMAAAGNGGRYEIAILPLAAAVTRESITVGTTLLAEAKNAIDKSSTPERNDNIRLAFSKINGLVLKDGQTFSFNNTVGNRNLANGFKSALGYVSGELVDVIGGGVCQVSTTLYSAALRAGLTIKERTPHSMPVSYIELGQDATVNYMRGHMIDLKFKNETGYPVYITACIEENAMGRLMSVVRIFGHALEDGVHYRVESTVTETLKIPDAPVVKVDKEGKYVRYTDQTYHYSKGKEGYVVKTYLQKLRGGTVVEQILISTDTYKAQPKVDYVGNERRP